MRYLSNLFELMSYRELKFLVGLVDGLLGMFFFLFFQYFCLQRVLLKACLLRVFTLPRKYFCYACLYEISTCSVNLRITIVIIVCCITSLLSVCKEQSKRDDLMYKR